MNVDPLALVYAGIQVFKLYRDEQRFEAEMAALKAKNLDPTGILEELHRMRTLAADEAHAAVGRMEG